MMNLEYKRIPVILLGLAIMTSLFAQKHDKKYEPKNLDEAISQLDILFSDKDKEEIFDMTEMEYTTNSHFSTGLWIRNNWGWWSDQDLTKYFNELGIYHPDDMSGIILSCYYRHLHSQDYKLDNLVKHYQDYWKKSQETGEKVKTDTAFARQSKLEFEKSAKEKIEELKLSYPLGSKIKTWVEYTSGGLRTPIEGIVVEWREVDEKGQRMSPDGTYFKLKDVEAKVRVTTFIEKNKKKSVEKQNQMKTDELWVNIERLEKTEQI
jgi:hypothetical protein